jgi:hypothetical protein
MHKNHKQTRDIPNRDIECGEVMTKNDMLEDIMNKGHY